jgi:2-desacetyl-2-hydroxyethyl bacteriochlorophyllide A dehydrogenase
MKVTKLVGPKKIELATADQPCADLNKVVIKVEQCGICGSDLHIWENGLPVDLIMGHEFSGTVAEGTAKDLFKIGDRVTALPANPCGTCLPCKNRVYNRCLNMMADAPGITTPGAFAEYMAINTKSVRKIPDEMSFEDGAMVEPSAVALHAVNLACLEPGDTVLIVGGGIIGLLSAAWARICGAAYIALSEVNPMRAQKALSFGDIDAVFDATDPKLQKNLLSTTQGGFTKVIECAGPAPAVTSAIGGAAQGATVVLAGINFLEVPVSTMRIAMRELTLKGSYGYSSAEFDRCIDYISRKVLNTRRFIDEIIDPENIQEAFTHLADPNGDAVKILVRF